MIRIVNLFQEESLLRKVIELYREDPVTHVYLFYDITEEVNATRVYLAVGERDIVGYALIWRAGGHGGVHLWGDVEPLLKCERVTTESFKPNTTIHLYNDDMLDHVVRVARRIGCSFRVRRFIDMVVDETSFKPWRDGRVLRLKPVVSHAKLISELLGVDVEEALHMIRRLRFHALVVDGSAVSVAGTCVRSHRVWVVCYVYTSPEYRGRGYAKLVTSSVTSDALSAGAVAYLHVDKENTPAIRVYTALGYRPIRERYWVFIEECSRRRD